MSVFLKTAITSILFLGMISSGSAQRKQMKKGKKLFESANYELAINEFTEAIQKDSSASEGFFWRGNSYLLLEENFKARIDLLVSNKLKPGDITTLLLIGNTYLYEQDYELGSQYFSESLSSGLEVDKDMASDIGTCYFFNAQYRLAKKYLDKAIHLGNSSALVRNNLAWTSIELSDFDQAIKLFAEAYETDKTDYRNVNNLGYAYYLLGNLKKAEKYVLESSAINDENSFVYRNLALIRMTQGRKKDACKYYQRALDMWIVEKWGAHYVQELKDYCEEETEEIEEEEEEGSEH